MSANSLLQEFYNDVQKAVGDKRTEYLNAKHDKNRRVSKDYLKKYPFVRSSKHYPSYNDVWSIDTIQAKYKRDYELITSMLIRKITGIYKHGQTDKTALCNQRIIYNSRRNRLTIAVSKNTLDAKDQWTSRLMKDQHRACPKTPLKDVILVVSSKKNDLNGNATHCKNIQEAIGHLLRGNYSVMFMCSNETRFTDIHSLLECYHGFNDSRRKKIDIILDEAHNDKAGIPPHRELVENIIMSPFVESFIPVSASKGPIANGDILWRDENLERHAVDYTEHSRTISTSENYSSISDAIHIPIEDVMKHSSYKNYGITHFDRDMFVESEEPGKYDGWSEEQKWEDVDKRRELEFTPFLQHETLAYNLALNFLDNNILETPLITSDGLNVHIMTTPLRKAFTNSLCRHAVNKPYNPICIGIYGSNMWVFYRNKIGVIQKENFKATGSSSNEVNEKINDILGYLKEKGESVKRPLLIMGNYEVTGEAITFVHYEYGTIRSQICLPSANTSPEKNYQAFLRSNYTDTRFKKNDPNFKHPEKFIIGFQEALDDAITYEEENDLRVKRLLEDSKRGTTNTPLVVSQPVVEEKRVSVPCKLQITDPDDPSYDELRKILSYARRKDEQKHDVLKLLHEMSQRSALVLIDPTAKFSWKSFTIKDIRTFKKYTEEEIQERKEELGEKYVPIEDRWRFKEFDSKHKNNLPYSAAKLTPGECHLYIAYDRYEYDGFVNQKTTMWMYYSTQNE
jgi:hypothetical protein